MKRRSRWVTAALCLHVGLCASSRAESFTTNIVSGTSTNIAADFIIGDTGSLNYLEINSGGLVTCKDGILGNSVAASNNTALVIGVNSAWVATFFGMGIGEYSIGNSLVISNGGHVNSPVFSVIGDVRGANSNSVVVTGTNSIWSNSGSLMIGYDGSGNQLLVLNGGQVVSNSSVWLSTDRASNNVLVVDGSDSRLIDNGSFVMGAGGPGNQFTLSGGAKLICNGASIESGANVVTITGSNTVWSNSGLLAFGYSRETNNQITISGGAVANDSGVIIGDWPASNNTVLVTGSNTLWQITSAFYVSSPGNTITVTNGARVNSGGLVIDSESPNPNNPNVITVADGSVWSNAGSLVVGSYGDGNELDIEGGSQVVGSTNITIGASYSYSSSNVLTIAGQNSRLTDSGSFIITGVLANSGYNRVIVRDGGALITLGHTIIGYFNTVVENSFSIMGTGSVWSNAQVYIYSSSNVLSITDGAYMYGDAEILSGSDNLILLSGPGTHVDGGFDIGSFGNTNNSLIVSNGATLNGGLQLDYGSKVTLTGTNTTCSDSGTLYVIYQNQMSILDGAQLLGNQFVHVDGSGCNINIGGNGARWGKIGVLYFGDYADGNSLTIGVGGSVDAKQMFSGSSGPSNIVSVAGTLTVTNGGTGQIQLQHGQIILQQGVVMTDLLSISAGTSVTGCGTIIGNINNSGTLAVTCPGGTLTLNGIVTNNATVIATNNADIEFLGAVVNNGTINIVNGFAHFPGGFINHGTYVDASSVLKSPSLNFSDANVLISFGCVSGKTYAVEYTDNMMPSYWVTLVSGIIGSGGGTQFTDIGAASLTQRFYRVHLTLP